MAHPLNHRLVPVVVGLLVVFFATATAALLLGVSPLLALFLSGALGAALLFRRHPLLLLSLLLVARMSLDYSSEFFQISFRDYHMTLSQALGGAIAALGALLLFLQRKKLGSFPLLFPFGLLIAWGLSTAAYSIAPATTLKEVLRLFDLFSLAFFAFAAVKSRDDVRTLFLAFFASSLLPILFGAYQSVYGIGFEDADVSIPRIFGTFSHPNIFSLYLFTIIVFALLALFLFVRNRRERVVLWGFLGLLLLMLFLTYARVAWVALFLFGVFLAFFRYRLLLFPILLLPLVLFAFSGTFQSRVAESLHPDPDSSIVWRQTLWHDVTLKSVQDGRRLLGSGMDTFPIVSESLRGTRLGSNDPHNDFVKFFVEGGYLGLAVFALYLFSIFFILLSRFLRTNDPWLRTAFGFLILLFLVLEIAALSDNIFKNTPVGWLFFIALGAFLALSKKQDVPQT
jgi:O-antigen ligase